MSQMNLLPEYYVKQRVRYRIDMICVVLFGMIMAGILYVGYRSRVRLEEEQGTHEEVTARYSKAAETIGDFFQLQNTHKKLLEEAQTASGMEVRIPRSYLLAMLTKACPEGLSLEAIDIGMVRPKVKIEPAAGGRGRRPARPATPPKTTKESDAYTTINIQGIAKESQLVYDFSRALMANPLVKDSQESQVEGLEINGKRYQQFRMSVTLHREIDVRDILQKETGMESQPAPASQPVDGGASL